jgi:hypothetical protein
MLPRSAKGADARRQTGKELASPWGGALDSVPVLHEFLKKANICSPSSGKACVRLIEPASFPEAI